MIYAQEVLTRFQELLCKRLELAQGGHQLTEDEIQDSLDYSLVQVGGIPEYEIRLEFEHPSIKGKKLDSFVLESESHGAAACEIKYDRRPLTRSKAGALLNDIFRLAGFEGKAKIERLIVYVSEGDMASSLERAENSFMAFFALRRDEKFPFTEVRFNQLSATTRKPVKTRFSTCTAACRHRAELPHNHTLLVWEIHPLLEGT